jgi:hypothetical protein
MRWRILSHNVRTFIAPARMHFDVLEYMNIFKYG